MPHILSVENLTVSLGHRPVLQGISFNLAPGDIVALVGANGAGKSTLLRTLAGWQRHSGGNITLQGAATLVPDQLETFPGLKVCQVLDYASRCHGQAGDVVARHPHLAPLMGRMADELSHGQLQQLHWVLGQLGSPRLVMLDEPTQGLDPLQRQALYAQLKRNAADGQAILFSTHNLDEAQAMASRVLVINHGQLVADEAVTAKTSLHSRVDHWFATPQKASAKVKGAPHA